MKYLSIIMAGMLCLTACQQETAEKQAPVAVESTEERTPPSGERTPPAGERTPPADENAVPEKQTAHNHEHDHAKEMPANGQKYLVVEPQQECEEPIVIEFFAYHCPHCYSLEPHAEEWRKKNPNVKFHSIPWDLGRPEFGSMVLVHHAAKLLGILDKVVPALFKRFHEDKKLFSSPEEAAEFLVGFGVDAEKAKQVLADQETMTKSIEADYKLLGLYKITSVPQVLVNHHYMTSTTTAGSAEAVFQVVDETLKLKHSCKAKD